MSGSLCNRSGGVWTHTHVHTHMKNKHAQIEHRNNKSYTNASVHNICIPQLSGIDDMLWYMKKWVIYGEIHNS